MKIDEKYYLSAYWIYWFIASYPLPAISTLPTPAFANITFIHEMPKLLSSTSSSFNFEALSSIQLFIKSPFRGV